MTILRYKEIQEKSRTLLDKHGLKDWRVSVENLHNGFYDKCGGILGCVDIEKKTIRIDWRKPRSFRQTLLHEIAHALRGVPGHDQEWIAIASKIGCTDAHLWPYLTKI